MRRMLAAVALAAALGGCSDDETPHRGGFDANRAFADVEAQVEIGQRPAGSEESRETARLIAARLRSAGVEAVRIQRPHLNVVGTIPGSGRETVVVGAHHDTKDDVGPGFEGANDGASGVAVVLELARSLPDRIKGASIHLALFDAEEARPGRAFVDDGIRGSRQYLDYARKGGRQGSPPLEDIRAMILFDLVGDCDLQIPREVYSDAHLYGLFADASKLVDGDPAPFVGEAAGVLDDHGPFVGEGIPAVDLIDFTFGPGPAPGAFWHTPGDTLDKVCHESLDAVGEAAIRALPRIAGGG